MIICEKSAQDYLSEVCSINNLSVFDGGIEKAGPGNELIPSCYVDGTSRE